MHRIPEQIHRAQVWSARLRLAHWALALNVLWLLGFGWLLAAAIPLRPAPVAAAHPAAGYVLVAVLMFRLYLLLFGRGAEHWRDFLPQTGQHHALAAMLRFYLTGGRAPLPPYYAHNPLWGPLYLTLFAVLLLQCVTGALLAAPAAGRWPTLLLQLHHAGYVTIAAFTAAHVAAVFLHDWRGGGAELSAMVSGTRYYTVRPPEAGAEPALHRVRPPATHDAPSRRPPP